MGGISQYRVAGAAPDGARPLSVVFVRSDAADHAVHGIVAEMVLRVAHEM